MTESRQTGTDSAEDDAERDEETDRTHLSDVEVGAGCTEIWEHLSEHRSNASDD
ncbi:MAG: hypothetical protein V5A27_02955 [Halapricum sp.]|jgi:hypothetical protein